MILHQLAEGFATEMVVISNMTIQVGELSGRI